MGSPARSHNASRYRRRSALAASFAVLAVLVMLMVGRIQPVGAQADGPVVVDPASCGHFDTQEDAQATLDERPELAATLDPDGNGIACETLPKGTDGGTTGENTGETTGGTTSTAAPGSPITLPNTGVGSSQQASAVHWILPFTAIVFAFAGLLSLYHHGRRMSDTRL